MKPRPSLRVVSGNLVYEEQLFKGGLRTRFWSPNGLIKPDADLEPGSGGWRITILGRADRLFVRVIR